MKSSIPTFLLFLFSSYVCTSMIVSAWTTTTTTTTTNSSVQSSRRLFFKQTVTKFVPFVAITAITPAFADELYGEPTTEPARTKQVVTPVEPIVRIYTNGTVQVITDSTNTPVPVPPNSNDFIARLKAQSDANAEKYKKDAQRSDKLSIKQFKDQYKKPTYIGIRSGGNGDASDASKSAMVLPTELEQLLKVGKVIKSYESKTNKKSGEISDDYAKPIYVFVNESN